MLTCLVAAGGFVAISAQPARADALGFGSCNCSPSVVVLVNSVNYSDLFQVTTVDNQHYSITGSVTTPNFSLTLNAMTFIDPVINYDLSFEGGGTVAIAINQSYLGGPLTYNTLTSQVTGALSDLSGDGSASVGGFPWIQSARLNGAVVTQQLPECSATGTSGFQNAQCSPSVGSGTGLPRPDDPFFPTLGNFALNLTFALSADDLVRLSGSTELVQSTAPPPTSAPEPATLGLVAVGLLTSGASARRRRSRARG